MRVKIDDNAIKELSKIEKKEAIKIFFKIEKLVDFPRVANFKKLVNYHPPFRLRVGNYRVLFDVKDDIIMVYSVKHRKNSYK